MKLLVTAWIVATILFIILLLITITSKKERGEINKWLKFECGFERFSPSRSPFSFQFFLIALLFLIFDIEITIVLSLPLEPTNETKKLLITRFLLLLTLGLFYEWLKGKIDWSKWARTPSLARRLFLPAHQFSIKNAKNLSFLDLYWDSLIV
jgi:NADH-ubiquinone oxidoreductase chain 3